jgi:sugar phosphate permease
MAGIIADSFAARNRSFAMSIYLLASPFSVMAAGWAGGRVADEAGWRMSMFSFSVMGFVIGGILILLLREPARTERQSGVGLGQRGGSLGQTLGSVLQAPTFLLLALSYVLVATVAQLTLFWLPPYFSEQFDMNLAGAGRMSTIWIQTGTVLGLVTGGVWGDRWAQSFRAGRFSVQLIGLLFCVPALGVMGSSGNVLVLRCAMTAYGVASWLYLSNLWSSAFDIVDPAARSTTVGLLNVASGVFGAWVSPLVGKLREDGVIEDLGSVFVGSAVTTVIAACLVIVVIFLFLRRSGAAYF